MGKCRHEGKGQWPAGVVTRQSGCMHTYRNSIERGRDSSTSKSAMRQIAYPFHIDNSGRTADAGYDLHIRQLIEQLLFTSQGERVNRPDFGTGIDQLVFTPNNDELATATEYLVQGALQQWLADLIHLESVTIKNVESELQITVQYQVLRNQERQIAQFSREV